MRCIDPDAHDAARPRRQVSRPLLVYLSSGVAIVGLIAVVSVATAPSAHSSERVLLAQAKPKPPPANRPKPKTKARTETPDAAVDTGKKKADLPSGVATRRLVKVSLITFNNAVRTGNFTVLHAISADAFRRKYKPAGLRWLFRDFRKRKVDIAAIVNLEPVWAEAPHVDKTGQLRLRGYFATVPLQVRFDLSFAKERKLWRLTRIGLDVGAPQ